MKTQMSSGRWAVSFLLATAGLTAQVVEIPGTPAGKALAKWQALYDEGDFGSDFTGLFTPGVIQAHRAYGDAPFMAMQRKDTGGFEVRSIETNTPVTLSGLMVEKTRGRFVHFDLEVSGEPSAIITRFDIKIVPEPAPAHLSERELIPAVRAYVEKLAAQDQFSGVVLLARRDKVLFEGAYGMADRERKVPNGIETRFDLASMGKMFTAVSVMQLAEKKKLAFSQTLADVLPDYPNQENARRITIAQLLTHTSGITGNIFSTEFTQVSQYIGALAHKPLEFDPGSKWSYSNYGFVVLGAVVEKVSGENYYDYVKDHVFQPAGMTNTGYPARTENGSGIAIGYMRPTVRRGDPPPDFSKKVPNTETLPIRGSPAGGGYSTVHDLLRFSSSLLNHKILGAEPVETMWRGKAETPRDGSYAYGFFDDVANGQRFVGHSGGAPGISTDLRIFPGSGYQVIVLSNYDGVGRDVSAFISNRLPKE